MATLEVAPLVLKDMVVTIGTDGFEKAIDQVTFTPTTSSITFRGGTPDAVFTDISSATWAVTLNYAQDWDSTDSLSQYLLANEGTTVSMTFEPKSGSGGSFDVDVVITPGSIGGSVQEFATSSVTLPCTGKPAFTPAA